MAKLVERTVDAIKPDPAGDIVVWDDDLAGFGLRVKSSGVKSYLIQNRNRDRVSRRYTFARHGVLTPDEARDKARRLLGAVADGRDPAAEKDDSKAALTVAELAEIYLREGPAGKPNKKLSSWATDRSNIERNGKPLLGRRIARSLSQSDIAKFQADVAAGKSKADIKTKKRGRAIVEGGRSTAARSLAVLGAMCNSRSAAG
jgi:Arm DNA-binding domain